jgi:hypothetical protein
MKSGAWTPCTACGYRPTGPEDLAKALMLSDNCLAPDKLAEFSQRRQQGEPWNFSPEVVELFKQRVAALIPLPPDGQPAPPKSGPAGPGGDT